MRGVFYLRRPSRVSLVFRNEQKLSSPAGIFEILASQHVMGENVKEMPLGQEMKLNGEPHIESVERELAFHV